MAGDPETDNSFERYDRQIRIHEIGVEGQMRLSKAHIFIVGCGGLGCPSALYLAGAGVGHITLVDGDTVSISNLHRQIGHSEEGAKHNEKKVESLKNRMKSLNSTVNIRTINTPVTCENVMELVSGQDVVLDCCDNIATRYILNDACILMNIPLVSGAAQGLDGQITIFSHQSDGPCYRCLYPTFPHTVHQSTASSLPLSVMSPLPGVIGSMQAIETMKLLIGFGSPLVGRMIMYSALTGSVRNVKLRGKQESCVHVSKVGFSMDDCAIFLKNASLEKNEGK